MISGKQISGEPGRAILKLPKEFAFSAMISRRQFLADSVLFAAGLHLRPTAKASPESSSSVEVGTPLGRLRGTETGGVLSFRGVSFAQPPVGKLRFRPPQPLTPWTGIRDATRFAAAPMQPDAHAVAQSEDCLYLNVWAPAGGGPYPVFVWIHGGGFTGGYSFDPLFDGTEFARNGVVCVTVGYRLGLFGFADMEPLLGASYAGSGNNALRDLTAALTWVQSNIGAFGGDPKRVTIGGESAGAKLTDTLMGVPSAQPLFHQMISESGGAERIASRAQAQAVGEGIARSWKEHTQTPPANILEAPAQQIIAVQQAFTRSWPLHFPLRPEVDGKLLPQRPLETIRQGSVASKRLLIGTNRDESALFIGPHPEHDPTAKDLGNMTVEQMQPIEQAYRKLFPGMDPELLRIRMVSAEEYWVPSIRVAQATVQGHGEAFLYRFDYPGSGRFAHLAFHAEELRFVWEKLPATAAATARTLAGQIHKAWVSFIKGETPSAPGLPAWPAYSPTVQQTMILDATSRVENGPQADELALWNGLLEH